MATCKNCFHYEACSGFKPTVLDKDVWHYCQMGIPEEIPDIDQRCDSFKNRKSWVEVVRCKDCKHWQHVHEHIPHMECQIFCGAYEHGYPTNADDFCSYGERKDNVL